jgi:2-dehydro-3-deoxyglucarate aldolase/4-hydroxy-2-oxoheptanedioate aldolase
MPKNRFREAVRNGRRPVGTWLMTASPVVSEAMSYAGFDFLVIDMEHAPNEAPNALAHMQAIAGGGADAVVRLPWNDPVMVKKALDAGAQTLIVPMIQSPDEAWAAVRSTRYPPQGTRGVAAMHRASRYGSVSGYLKRANEEICVVPQIETAGALERIEAIAGVEGVEALFLGPGDLAASLGHIGELDHPEVLDALRHAVQRAHAAGKPAGILAHSEQSAVSFFAQGYDFVAISSDFGFLMRQTRAVLQHIEQSRPSFGGSPPKQ